MYGSCFGLTLPRSPPLGHVHMHVAESFVMVVYVLVLSPAIFVRQAPSVYSVDSSVPFQADTGVGRFTTSAKRRATRDTRGRYMLLPVVE